MLKDVISFLSWVSWTLLFTAPLAFGVLYLIKAFMGCGLCLVVGLLCLGFSAVILNVLEGKYYG